MAQLIFKCPYLKGGGSNTPHLKHITNYISTREGVEFITEQNGNLPATKKQEEFILQLLKEFPDSKNLFEYEDYIKNKTIENASDFISMAIEYNIDVVAKKEHYIDYIANRPMVEKISTHGLFTIGNKDIVLSKVAKEVSEHKGNVWLPIIALRREDAERSGFDNVESWKILLEQYALEVASNLKIPHHNFRWYAAFHNHKHHPHVHMICYSINPKEGFLTKTGIKNIKSGLMQNIYGNELNILYAEKTMKRDELKAESKKAVEQLMFQVANSDIQNTKLEDMILELSQHLKCTTGKRVYGYLPPRIKEMVDEITDELAKQPSVAKAYDLWYELQKQVAHNYSDKDIPKLPLSQQKEFKSIKNHIIYEADKLSKGEISLTEFEKIEISEPTPMEDDIADEYAPQTEDIEIAPTKPYVKWTDEYKQAREFLFGTDKTEPNFEKALELLQAESQNGNMLAVFDLGRMYTDGLGMEVDTDKAQEYYALALDGFTFIENRKPWKYLEYRIGKMYAQGLGTEKDDELASHWFEKSANQKYKYAEYSLGGLYYRGKGVEQSYEKALKLYQRSANQNFPYADYEVAKMLKSGVGTEIDEKLSDYHFRKAFVGFISMEKQSHDDKLQYRIGSMLLNGIGTEKDIPKAKEYFEKSAKIGNSFACYSLAKIVLSEENPTQTEIEKAVLYLQTACNSGNQFAEYSLGKVYIEGRYVQQNIDKALELFTSSADKGSEYAQYQLGKIYITGELLLKDTEKAIHYLTQSAEQGNQFSQYALGKLYLMGKDVAKDKETAIKWFTLSAEQGNEYAQFFLDNMDKWKDPSVSLAVSNLMHHLGRVFENNQPPQKSNVGMSIDSKRLKKLREKKMAQGHKADDHQPQIYSY